MTNVVDATISNPINQLTAFDEYIRRRLHLLTHPMT